MGKKIAELVPFLGTWALAFIGVILVLTSLLHRLQLDTNIYTKSPLIPLQFIVLIIVMVLVPVHLIYAIVLMVKREWKAMTVVLINAIVGVGAVMAAMAIDYPTFIYMT